MITLPQAQYLAYQLTRQLPSDSVEKFSEVLLDAKVELNPHQVEAALFAFKSPLSGGAILADEVGLGKTIEAGLLISQKWAEGKRKILIICPSSLRKQWSNEMMDKFYLPSIVLEKASFKKLRTTGNKNPFQQSDNLVICSYHFARNMEAYVAMTDWDLVIIDEAHKLRNAYRESNVIGRSIMIAVKGKPQVLLTATPLQNSIMEIFGLVSFIAPHTFGDQASFKRLFSYAGQINYAELRDRLKPLIHRTLRSQVRYLQFTERHALTFEFTPTDREQLLYDEISNYLQREELFALPSGQRQLLTLIIRKLLASSSFAIAKTLQSMINRLELLLKEQSAGGEEWQDDYEASEDYADEDDDNDDIEISDKLSKEDLESLKKELSELKGYYNLALSIGKNAKAERLKTALREGFLKLEEKGAPRKALIFTESKRTQSFLFELLNAIPEYEGKIVLFNGQNSDPTSKAIYQAWKEKNKYTDKTTGSIKVDIRQALVEEFEHHSEIMIATEAAAEGINLQFCAMVVNFDLPWNPQRIEQRIGRCHRYGQKNDVVVVNFLNVNNEADRRVHELLDQKFKLFTGVFGASDEILGAIESGTDFEKKIAEIYQNCRTSNEIKEAFDNLEKEIDQNENIRGKFENARTSLFENFDAEVINKLKVTGEQTTKYLNRYEEWLWQITKFFLHDDAVFKDSDLSFHLNKSPLKDIPSTGDYVFLDERSGATRYRMRHPLAQYIIHTLKEQKIIPGTLHFYPKQNKKKWKAVEPYLGKKGQLQLFYFKVSSFETVDFLFGIARTHEGEEIPQSILDRLMLSEAEFVEEDHFTKPDFTTQIKVRKEKVLSEIKIRDTSNFKEETSKLTKWSEDKEKGLEKEIDDVKKKIRELQNEKAVEDNEDQLLRVEENIQRYDKLKRKLRREIMDVSDQIFEEREQIITDLKKRMQKQEYEKPIFTLNFEIHR